MRKRIVIILITGILLAVIAFGVVRFFSPGVHFAWRLANFNMVEQACYIVDASGGEIVDQTSFTIKGFENDFRDSAMSDYRFEIKNYTDVITEHAVNDLAAMLRDGEWEMVYHAFSDADGDLLSSDADEPWLWVTVRFIDGTPVAWIRYDEEWGRDDVYAACADTREDALRICREFHKA